MASAKDIIVKPISAKSASTLIKRLHYSGKVVNSSCLHFGVFLDGVCHGAMSFGSPMDKRKSLKLVSGTPWNGMLELNRMAFGSALPRNSESRAISIALRIIKKNYPQIKWILSFADGTQCGDGTIYRASGFVLTAIKQNKQIIRLPSGEIIARKTLDNPNHVLKRGGYKKPDGLEYLPGFQLRYVYFLDSEFRKNLTVKEIPFSKIKEMNAGMYLGKKRAESKDNVAAGFQPVEGGAIPTSALQTNCGDK